VIHASTWHFTGNDGKPWKAKLELDRGADARHDVKASLSVARAE